MSIISRVDEVKQLSGRGKAWRCAVLLAAGLLLFGWLMNTPSGLLGKADAIGYAVCHRIDTRSFHLGERPISLCARCSGMYLGAMLGLLYQVRIAPRRAGVPSKKILAVLAMLVLAFGIDGGNSYITLIRGTGLLYEPNNTLRLLTGTGMGFVMAAALFPAFNQTVWQRISPHPALSSLRQLGVLFALGLGVDLLVLSENPLLLYPLALISAGGVMVILTMVYSMVWLMLFRAENRIERARELLFPLIGGFVLALLQIALIDIGRYILTGTWEGFHIILG